MPGTSSPHPEGIAGRYRTDAGEWTVTLRRVGESYALAALDSGSAGAMAHTDDRSTLAASFQVLRAGADRYPDWADFEWKLRLGSVKSRSASVWRIAEDRERIAYLGLSIFGRTANRTYPLAAALWRGWSRTRSVGPRALLWSSGRTGHLWYSCPFKLPCYTCLGPNPQPETVVCAVASLERPEQVILETGGMTRDEWRKLMRIYPGQMRQVEPFVDLIVPAGVRQQLSDLADPTPYLPAIGAARALAEGAPPVENSCASLPEAAADGA